MHRIWIGVRSWAAFLVLVCAGLRSSNADIPDPVDCFERGNLVAWCVVPFDARKRGPEARAEMLTRQGIFRLAYDWRAEHIPEFDEENDPEEWGVVLELLRKEMASNR